MIEADRKDDREGSSQQVRFGVFEADLEAGELRKNGLKVQLPDQPFRILTILLERPGQVVSRDELKERLWPADTYVDFDHGLNAAIRKLRRKLGDFAENPRFLETLPKRGYRFIAPVERLAPPQQLRNDDRLAATSQRTAVVRDPTRSRLRATLIALGSLLLGVVLGSLLFDPRGGSSLPLRTFAFEHEGPSFQSVISPNGRYVAYSIRSGLRLKDLSNGSLRTFDGT